MMEEELIKNFEEKKQKFLDWIETGEPNPVFKRLYRRKFKEIFDEPVSNGVSAGTLLNNE
jgi:hypothetical protein